MNRRKFIQSLAAALAIPAAPAHLLKPALAAFPTAVPATTVASAAAIATKARFWAIYMTGLHGNCTPATLSTMLNVPESQARGYLNNLVADGTIRPHALFRHSMRKTVKSNSDGVVDKLRERLEIKRETKTLDAYDEIAQFTDDDVESEALVADGDDIASGDAQKEAEIAENASETVEAIGDGLEEELKGAVSD